MRCEVCGRKIFGKPNKVVIEGAKLTVCDECAKHGKTTWEELTPKAIPLKTRATPKPLKIQSRNAPDTTIEQSVELMEGFYAKIRQAREKLGFSHEELGRRLNEKVSLLRKIEMGKMTPDNTLATKLERALKIKLLVPASAEKASSTAIPKTVSRELTLGDLIQLGKKGDGKEELTKRKPS